jgi:hypothetical protein
MESAFKSMGYKTEVQPLSHYHDDYGLAGDEHDRGEGEEDEEDGSEFESGDEGSSEESGDIDK